MLEILPDHNNLQFDFSTCSGKLISQSYYVTQLYLDSA